jgi:methyl-accepting chemotaxis protein
MSGDLTASDCSLPTVARIAPATGTGERVFDSGALADEVAVCLPLFPVLASQLRETVGQVEAAVVVVCQGFADMAHRARDTVDQTPMGGSKSGEIGSLVSTTRAIMAELLQQVEQTSALSATTVQRMREIEGRMNGLESTLAEIDTIASRARLLALNGQIEAARSGAAGAAFGIVATETAKMADHARTASQTIRTMIGSLAVEIAGASAELRQRAALDTDHAVRSRAEVNRALDNMAELHGNMCQAMEQARRNSEELTHDISQAVTAMQFQDTVSQRIGHVIETLEETHAALQAKIDPSAGKSAVAPGSLAKDMASHMARQYTMASERHTLAAHLGQAKDDAHRQEDNVCLF